MKPATSTTIAPGGLVVLLTAASLLAGPAFAAPREVIAEDLEVERLADGVWLHVSYQEMESYGRVGANGLVVVSDGEAALLDTPWTDAQTRALATWVEERLGARLSVVVPTHSHSDCMGGLAVAHELGARSVAGLRTVEFAKRDRLPVPLESFEGRRDVALGSRVLEVRDVGAGHTADTVVVWLPDAGILFGGDLVRSASSRALGYTAEADLEAWPASVQALVEAYGDAHLIVPGHGAPGGRELLERTLELLSSSP